MRDFIEHYAAHIADHSRPFPGLEAALDEIAARGCRLAVCTNKLEWLSVRLLDALGLSQRFAAICGSDTFGLQKPTRNCCGGRSSGPAGLPDSPSWSAIPPTTSPPRSGRYSGNRRGLRLYRNPGRRIDADRVISALPRCRRRSSTCLGRRPSDPGGTE